MKREQSLKDIHQAAEPFDFCIVGGGASGLGASVDAASRGHSVVLLEQADFAKGTSSRSTKLVPGGVLRRQLLDKGGPGFARLPSPPTRASASMEVRRVLHQLRLR